MATQTGIGRELAQLEVTPPGKVCSARWAICIDRVIRAVNVASSRWTSSSREVITVPASTPVSEVMTTNLQLSDRPFKKL